MLDDVVGWILGEVLGWVLKPVLRVLDTTSFGVYLLGLGLAIGLPAFFLASLIARSGKVGDEELESRRRRLPTPS